MGDFSFRIDDKYVFKKINSVVPATESELRIALDELGKIGENEMKHVIKTSGTKFSRFRASKGVGSSGRIRSGKMYNAASYRIEKGPKVMRLAIGFVRGRAEKYFKYQDQGFNNIWKLIGFGRGKTSGPNAPEGFEFSHWRNIPNARPSRTRGMFALRDAKAAVIKSQNNVFGKMKARITRRVNAGR